MSQEMCIQLTVTHSSESCRWTFSSVGACLSYLQLAGRRMNEVTLHWTRLVLRWLTIFGRVYHFCM